MGRKSNEKKNRTPEMRAQKREASVAVEKNKTFLMIALALSVSSIVFIFLSYFLKIDWLRYVAMIAIAGSLVMNNQAKKVVRKDNK